MDQSLLSIKNKKFPSALPVLTMISSENVQNLSFIHIWTKEVRTSGDRDDPGGYRRLAAIEGWVYTCLLYTSNKNPESS